MAERISFLDSFDHTGPAWAPAKYVHAAGTYTEVPGPRRGVAARFAARGAELGAARTGAVWDSGAWSASLRVDATGWTGSGEVAFLAPCWWSFISEEVVDFPHHWLTVDSAGTLRVRRWAALPGGPPDTAVLAASAAGALPLGQWVRLEYRTQIRSDSTSAGTVGVRVDGAEVITASGLVTHDPQRALVQADHFRFGHLQTSTADDGNVGGLGSGGEAVPVAVDDVCQRGDTTLGAALLAYRDDPALPHRVVCLRPTGPGSSTEFPVTGAAANWDACDEVPPDGDTSYVERLAVGSSAELPLDLYATAAAPLIVEGSAGAALRVWGLAGPASGATRATVAWRTGLGSTAAAAVFLTAAGVPALPYRYVSGTITSGVEALTDAHLAGLEIGWGSHSSTDAPLAQTYRGTQVVAELWYRPTEPDPEPGGGAQRWSVGWVG
jgi:hypothetical protein